jgi:hypothetical protein
MTHPRSIRLAILRRCRPDIAHVQDWLDDEREYAENKWAPGEVDDSLSAERYAEFVEQYLSRALVLTLENPLGRQALGKALRTAMAMTESVVRTYGPLPPGGLPSGQLTIEKDITMSDQTIPRPVAILQDHSSGG